MIDANFKNNRITLSICGIVVALLLFQTPLMAAASRSKKTEPAPVSTSSKLDKIPNNRVSPSEKTPDEEIYEKRSDAAAQEAAESLARQFKGASKKS